MDINCSVCNSSKFVVAESLKTDITANTFGKINSQFYVECLEDAVNNTKLTNLENTYQLQIESFNKIGEHLRIISTCKY